MQLRCPIRISIAAKLSSVDIVDDHAPSHALHRVEVSQCVLQCFGLRRCVLQCFGVSRCVLYDL